MTTTAEKTTAAPLPDLPTSIPRQDVLDALAGLGIEHRGLISVTFDRGAATLTYRRVDSDGRLLIAGDEFATTTTTIGIGAA